MSWDDEPTGYEEHLEHEMGCYPNEFAAAYALSRREFNSGRAAAAALVAAGRHVVVASSPAYCRYTDALLGESVSVMSDHATRAEALAALPEGNEDDLRYVVMPPAAESGKATAAWLNEPEDGDIPF